MYYAYLRGPGAKRRVMHLTKHDSHGEVSSTWCGRPFNTTINVKLGLRLCKDCARRAWSR